MARRARTQALQMTTVRAGSGSNPTAAPAQPLRGSEAGTPINKGPGKVSRHIPRGRLVPRARASGKVSTPSANERRRFGPSDNLSLGCPELSKRPSSDVLWHGGRVLPGSPCPGAKAIFSLRQLPQKAWESCAAAPWPQGLGGRSSSLLGVKRQAEGICSLYSCSRACRAATQSAYELPRRQEIAWGSYQQVTKPYNTAKLNLGGRVQPLRNTSHIVMDGAHDSG